MGKEALSIGANTFQFFTRNPRGGDVKPMNIADAEALNKLLKENNFARVLAHAPYTLNLCSADSGIREFAKRIFAEDLARMEYIEQGMLNFHPGSHVKQGVETGITFIVDALNGILSKEQKTLVLLETMAGKGSEVGRNFEELAEIIKRVELNDKLGVCLDTCHVHDAGYDIVNTLDSVLEEFDKVIGLSRLKAIHLNDSKNPLGSHKDRHEVIGGGFIGLSALVNVINHPKLSHLPFYLETPNELPGYAEEIKLLRKHFNKK
jgi:deoxyribonuclease-4